MDWKALNHALLAHLPVASGLLLPWALLVSQRPGRGIRNWWTVCRYLGWMGLIGLSLAVLSGISEARGSGLMPPQRLFPLASAASGPQGLLFRHALMGLVSLPLAGFAIWSMNRPRKDHDNLGFLSLALGLTWSALVLVAGRDGYQLAHGIPAPRVETASPPVVPPPRAPEAVVKTVATKVLDYTALEPLHAEPVKSPAHGGRWIRVWVTAEAAAAYRLGQTLPAGALVVMSSHEDRYGRPGSEPGPLYALEQTVDNPILTFYWARIPAERRKDFAGEASAYWQGNDAQLDTCRTCHSKGLADPAKRSRWRASKVSLVTG